MEAISKIQEAGYHAELATGTKSLKFQELDIPEPGFWKNGKNWKRASF